MPAFGRDGMLKRDEIDDVANYVRRARRPAGRGRRPTSRRGKKIFADNCAACHGDDGKGNQELGAPPDRRIWLYGVGRRPRSSRPIGNGRGGVMPAWAGRLDPTTIKALDRLRPLARRRRR